MATSSTRKTTKKTTTRTPAKKTAASRSAKKEEIEEEAAAEQPVKRPRGRPKKKVEESVETEEVAAAEKPRRGRRPKAETAESETPAKTTRGRRKAAVETAEEEEAPAPRRRGRPAKVKVETAEEEAPAPKRRGRPPKVKVEEEVLEAAEEKPAPKRRGRPPKVKVEEEVIEASEEAAAPKRRGRKPKAVIEEETVEAAPKRRGRPPKVVVEEEATEEEAPAPKRRGRKPKHDPQPQLLFEDSSSEEATEIAEPQTEETAVEAATEEVAEEAPKKRRGRKPKAEVEAAPEAEEAPAKRRGRKPKLEVVQEAPQEEAPVVPALPQVNLDKVPKEFLQLGLREHTVASMAKVVDTLPEEAVTVLRLLGKNKNSCVKLESREMQVFLAVVGALNNVVNWIAEGEKEVASLILVSTTQQVKDTHECATAINPLQEICVVSDPEEVLGVENKPSILILTASQAEQLVREEKLSLSRVSNITTVDAQSILDGGYEKSVSNLFEGIQNPDAQKVVFSDTYKVNLRELIYLYIDSPAFPFPVENEESLKTAPQWGFPLTTAEKLEYLLGFVQKHKPKTALVFCNTKNVADWLAYKLAGNGIYTELTSWEYPGHKRNVLKEKIDKGNVKVVVTTDHVNHAFTNSNISHVYHFDVAPSKEAYLNRVSQGASGDNQAQNVLFVCDSYGGNLITLEEQLGIKVLKKDAPQYARIKDRCNEAFDDMGRVKPLWEAIQFSKTLPREKPKTNILEVSSEELEQKGNDVIDTLRKIEKDGPNERKSVKGDRDNRPQRDNESRDDRPQRGRRDNQNQDNPRKIVGGKTIRTDRENLEERPQRGDRGGRGRHQNRDEGFQYDESSEQVAAANEASNPVEREERSYENPRSSKRNQYTREQAGFGDRPAKDDPYTLGEEERKAVDSYRNSRRNDNKRRNHLQYDMAKEMIDAAKNKAGERSRRNPEGGRPTNQRQNQKHLSDAVGIVEHIEESLENLQETVREEIKKRPFLKKLANRFFGGNKRS